jgi:hypothetical protein
MVGEVQQAKRTVEERIPDLLIGPRHTTSSALHSVRYKGPLLEWTTFERDVNAMFQQQAWNRHNSTITIRPVGPLGPHNIAREHLLIGDETGVQGRFNQNVGHVMSAVYSSQGLNLRFGDFKGSNSTYELNPDVAIMNQAHDVKVVGELKTPWVYEHKLRDNPLQTRYKQDLFRKQIGQLARYMLELRLRYGVFSTYNQYVFLRQERVAGQWSLRYSPIVSDEMASPSVLTVRQCFFFLGRAADQEPPVANRTPIADWVRIGKS